MSLKDVGLLILLISAAVCIALFGHIPSLRNTPIGYIYRFFKTTLPNGILSIDKRLTGGAITSCLYDSGMYLATEKHPVIVIFYLILITGGISLYFMDAYQYLPRTQKVLAPIICTFPYITLYKAVYSDPGIITKHNHQEAMSAYPYDFMLFFPGNECRTCRFLKPARSKHCSICRRCVSKMDHHCVWINNCVGKNNTRHFLLFLMATSLMLIYGAVTCGWVVTQYVNYEIPEGYDKSLIPWSDYITIWTSWMLDLPYTGSVFLLALLTSLLACSFTIYHLYLIYAGTTTNESSKWSDWSDDIKASAAFPSPPPDYNNPSSVKPPPGIYIATQTPPEYSHYPPGLLSWNMAENERSAGYHACNQNWPKRPDKYYARVALPGENEGGNTYGEELPKGDWGWQRLESLEHVDNLYDLGFWSNLKRVIWPSTI